MSKYLIGAKTTAPVVPTGDIYYLDASATGTHDGLSWANAWTTLAQAQTALNALDDNGSGDTVLVKNGSYGAYIESGYNISTVDQARIQEMLKTMITNTNKKDLDLLKIQLAEAEGNLTRLQQVVIDLQLEIKILEAENE